jgi:outer membrane protein TolC
LFNIPNSDRNGVPFVAVLRFSTARSPAMKLHRDRHLQQSIFFSVSLSQAVLAISYYCLVVSASGQAQPTPKPETTPLIPPAGQPSATPTAEPRLPENKGAGEETKPLIPAIQSPTPGPTAAKNLPSDVAAQLDQQYQEALQVHRVRPSFFSPLNLIDAVRLALFQNPDLRLANEDAQLARGSLKQATGQFDAKGGGLIGYSKTYIASSDNASQKQVSQVITQTLTETLQQLRINPGANIGQLVNQSATKAGGAASIDELQTVIAGFFVTKSLRNGIDLTVDYTPNLLDFQDQLAWPPATHEVNFELGFSITKFGTNFTAADETAARKDYEASLLTLGHAATKAVFNTVQAYWKEAAILERFYIADRSYRVNETLLSLTQELAKAQTIPQTEVTLAMAHKAEAFSARSAALIEALNAAKELAATLGLTEQQLRVLPFASERFPILEDLALSRVNLISLTHTALARRLDRLAAVASVDSKRVLTDKARVDLRPDVKVSVGAGGSLIDNRQSGSGGSGYSLQPTFKANVSLTYTFANNKKEGALLSAQANLDKSILSLEDVSRDIALSIQNDVETMQQQQQEIAQGALAVNYYTRSLTDMRERFRLGTATLIDTIQAEDRLDKAEAALIDAKSSLAQFIAKLRFDTATILTKNTALRTPGFPKSVEKLEIKREAFVTLPDLSKEAGPEITDRNYEPNIKYISGRPTWHH